MLYESRIENSLNSAHQAELYNEIKKSIRQKESRI